MKMKSLDIGLEGEARKFGAREAAAGTEIAITLAPLAARTTGTEGARREEKKTTSAKTPSRGFDAVETACR
jgi:hypothetical protein